MPAQNEATGASTRRCAIVAIGRNEGAALRVCLASALAQNALVIYVDSGSADGSASLARSLGIDVVELSPSVPFTAARARNAGFERACLLDPQIEAIQFIDADCELVPGWLEQASSALKGPVAVVFGRRREREREASVYNRLCDLDWDKPAGEVKECGGDALIRADAFRQAGGYNPALIAGEEPELCVRLRQNHWKILCIAEEMTIHDARMVSFAQWWKRTVRCGHAYAEGSWMHAGGSDRLWLRQTLSVWFWGGALPLVAVLLALRKPWAEVWIAALYLSLGVRIFIRERLIRAKLPARDALEYAVFCVLGKIPQALGQARFVCGRWSRRPSRLIEYKAT